jgi:aryl-alcohol dehydrogenase-like predicted oxidoreductase
MPKTTTALRTLGKTELELTTVGLGSWAIGGSGWQYGWGAQDDNEAVAALVKGLDLGINWIDTAPVYGDGHAEELVGRALQQVGGQRRPFVATKFGRIIRDTGEVFGRLTARSVRAECEASLRRLGIDAVDLYQMHWPDPKSEMEEGWTTAVRLKEEGLVKQIGVSNCSITQMKTLGAIHAIASLQPPYNMIVRGIEEEILGYCAEQQIGIVSYSPLCKGLLTGTFSRSRAANLPQDDHRSRDPKFAEPQLGLHLGLVDALRPIADRNDRSVSELAIAWVLRRPEVTSAIVGARHPLQIEDTAPAGSWALSPEDSAELEALVDAHSLAMRERVADTGRV